MNSPEPAVRQAPNSSPARRIAAAVILSGLVFAVLTDRSQVVYLPAKVGPSLLVSVEQPEQFLAAVRGAAAIGRR